MNSKSSDTIEESTGARFSPLPRGNSHVKYCCVPNCHSTSKDSTLRFHIIPKAGETLVKVFNFFGQPEALDRRYVWLKRLRLEGKCSPNSIVCSLHFLKDDYFLPNVPNRVRFLKKIAVPSLNLPPKDYVPVSKKQKKLERIKKAKENNKVNEKKRTPRKKLKDAVVVKEENFVVDMKENLNKDTVNENKSYEFIAVKNEMTNVSIKEEILEVDDHEFDQNDFFFKQNVEDDVNLSKKSEYDSSETIREALFALKEPVVFKNILSPGADGEWNFLNWSLKEFADYLDDEKLSFRVGKYSKTKEPQWEVDTPIRHKTFKEFLNKVRKSNSTPMEWFYFDYKRMYDWFKGKTEILKSVNWKKFGFDLDGSDSTMWIGSKGAHTNCHQDTYGCNLVAQIFGRKLWLLFSPESTSVMKPTRIPYEESTIFSKYNFFSPGKSELEVIKKTKGNVKMITLEPKDVLFVPKGWWHYVESLDVSISVNVWLPIKEDYITRLKESLVHLITNTVGEGVVSETINQQESNLLNSIQLIESSLAECNRESENIESNKNENEDMENFNFTKNKLKVLNLFFDKQCYKLSDLTNKNLQQFLNKNNIKLDLNERNIDLKNMKFDEEENYEDSPPSKLQILEAVVDAFTHPEVTSKVAQILKDKFVKQRIKNT